MVKVRVQVRWSRSGSMSDSQGQGPCQTVKVKVRFNAMVGSLDVDSHGQGRVVMTKRPSACQAERARACSGKMSDGDDKVHSKASAWAQSWRKRVQVSHLSVAARPNGRLA